MSPSPHPAVPLVPASLGRSSVPTHGGVSRRVHVASTERRLADELEVPAKYQSFLVRRKLKRATA